MKYFFTSFAIVSAVILSTNSVHAVDLRDQIVNQQLGASAQGAQVGTYIDPRAAAASMIKIFLSVMGSVFLALIIMSGYWLVTARGDEAKVEKAQTTIRGAIIGLIIVLIAYSITLFVTSRVRQANEPPPASLTPL